MCHVRLYLQGQTALLLAAAEGHLAVVTTLLLHGANVHFRCKQVTVAWLLLLKTESAHFPCLCSALAFCNPWECDAVSLHRAASQTITAQRKYSR